MKRIVKRVFLVLIVSAVCVSVGLRIYAVNQDFPAIRIIEVSPANPLEINDLLISVNSSEIITLEEFESITVDYADPADGAGGELKMLIFNIDIKNTGTVDVAMPIYKFVAESGAWRNGIEQNAFKAANPELELMHTISPDETISVKLVYALYHEDLSACRWEDIESREFYAVWLAYPVKIVLST